MILQGLIPPLLARLDFLIEDIRSKFLNFRGVKTAFFRDKVVIKFAEEEEKGKILQDTMAQNEDTAKQGLTTVSESMTSVEEEFVTKNASYFEKVEEVSGSYEIIDSMIGNWGNNSLEHREQDTKNLETIDAPLDEHSAFSQTAFVNVGFF